MNTEKFNLSDEIQQCPCEDSECKLEILWIEDVKEFIKRLKEEFNDWIDNDEDRYSANHIIDKLSGDKLI